MAHGPAQGAVLAGPVTVAGLGAHWNSAYRRSGLRWLATRWGKEGGHHRDSIFPSTLAWEAARRWHIGGGALAQKGNGVSVVETKRMRVGGVGIFTGWVAFYRAEARWGRAGVPSMAVVEGPSMTR
jgi:hypothetical protein